MTEVGWDIPGWDWEPGDYSWLSSRSGLYHDGVSIFFIHGGRIRHQANLPDGTYSREEFLAWFDKHAEGLDDPRIVWMDDSGDGNAGVWLEGTRPPNESDLARLRAAREHQRLEDEINLRAIMQRRARSEERR